MLREITTTNEDNYNKNLEQRYCEVDNVSIDYGIMERADDMYVIPNDFGWDDLGSWAAVESNLNNNIL